jgi:hypothetical protein
VSAQNILKLSAIAKAQLRKKCPSGGVRIDQALFGSEDYPMSALIPATRWTARHLIAVITLVLCLAQTPSARADSASCMANISSYVIELDALLSKEKNRLTPYIDLNERRFPFRDCEADALLEVVRRSGFLRSIGHHAGRYFILFANEKVEIGFTYYVFERKSNPGTNTVGWVNK